MSHPTYVQWCAPVAAGEQLPALTSHGSPIAYVCADGGFLCPSCANGGSGSIARLEPADAGEREPQWDIIGSQPAAGEQCEHCGRDLPDASTWAAYRKFRASSPFMLVGHNARLALDAARLLQRWDELESAGLVEIESCYDADGDASFYDTWEHLSERSREQLKAVYLDDCRFVITRARASTADAWEVADSIGGNSGYRDASSPFENCYVIDLMRAAVNRVEELTIGKPLQI